MFNVTRHTRVPKILSSRRANGKDVPREMHSLRCGRLPRFRREKRQPRLRLERRRYAQPDSAPQAAASPPARQKPHFGPAKRRDRAADADAANTAITRFRQDAARARRRCSPRSRRRGSNDDGFALIRRAGQGAPANKTPRARAEALFVPAARHQAPRPASVPRPRRAWLPDRLPKGPRGSPPRAARAPLP